MAFDIYFRKRSLGILKGDDGNHGRASKLGPDAAPYTKDFPVIEQVFHYPGLMEASGLCIFPTDPLPEMKTWIEHALPLNNDWCALSSLRRAAWYDGVYG
jgi:hypothetical protein